MPHLHLNLHNSQVEADDPEGADFADLLEAREAALRGIRSLLSEEIMAGKLDLHGHLDIVDDGGVLLESIRFADAVSITSPQADYFTVSNVLPGATVNSTASVS